MSSPSDQPQPAATSTTQRRILVLGATGACGVLLVRELLKTYGDAGCALTLYVRNPAKLPADIAAHPAVTARQGDLADLAALEEALVGTDAVLSALGPAQKGHPAGAPIAHMYEALIALMKKHGVRRLIALATPSAPDPHDKSSWTYWLMIGAVKLLVPTSYEEMRTIGETLRAHGGEGADGLDWTLVRVPMLTDADNSNVVAGYVGDGKTGSSLARQGFAAFVVKELEERQWLRTAPLITSV